MKVKELSIFGAKLLFPKVHGDERGSFVELYRASEYPSLGVEERFVQDNCSVSSRGAIRGMHFQQGGSQVKLVTVLYGEIFDVIVDLCTLSPTYGQWEGVTLSASDHAQLYVPAHCAHGFCVLSETACVMYKTSSYYDPKLEKGFRFDDPKVGIEWPTDAPILSEKDRNAPSFEEAME